MTRSKFPRQPPATQQRKRARGRPLPPRGGRVYDGPRLLGRGGVARGVTRNPTPGGPFHSSATPPREPSHETDD